MSADLSVPLPRQAADELFRPGDPVIIDSEPHAVVLGCAGCGAEITMPLEPVTPMLDAVGDFVSGHAACR